MSEQGSGVICVGFVGVWRFLLSCGCWRGRRIDDELVVSAGGKGRWAAKGCLRVQPLTMEIVA